MSGWLDQDGTSAEASSNAAGRYGSVVLHEFWVDRAWFWQDPLPDPNDLRTLIAPP